jgi:hypothetical protein
MTPEQSAIAARYAAAYEHANGHAVAVTYSRGWFTIAPGSGSKWRASDLVKMADVLEARAGPPLDLPPAAGDYLDRFPAAARPYCERAYNDGATDGASYGETLADAVRAALDDRAGPPANQLAAIRAALEAYDAEGEPGAHG